MLFSYCLGLVFYRQLLEQLIVASLSNPTVFLQCYSLLLLYFGRINDDDNFDANNIFEIQGNMPVRSV